MAHSSLLRASGERAETALDLRVVIGSASDPDGGVPHGALLQRLARAILDGTDDLATARTAVHDTLGERAAVHACQIVAAFDGINRVADVAGIRTDEAMTEEGQRTIATLDIAAMESL